MNSTMIIPRTKSQMKTLPARRGLLVKSDDSKSYVKMMCQKENLSPSLPLPSPLSVILVFLFWNMNQDIKYYLLGLEKELFEPWQYKVKPHHTFNILL